MIDFARTVLELELDPWQQWLAIHIGELLEDGRPRFRTALVLVARQNGKTTLGQVLILYWLAFEARPMVLATSTDRSYAKSSWREVCDIAERNKHIDARTRKAIGEEALIIGDCEYQFAANNGRAGRSLTVHRLLVDELREHHNWDCWGSANNAMRAVPDGQAIAITNQGDTEAVVLDSFRDSALSFMETGVGDPRLGLFEWSAPTGADVTDPEALAAANPNLGDRITLDSLIGDATRAKEAGGEELASFRTEVLCQKVRQLDAAIDPDAWARCATETPIDMKRHRDRVALCLDVSLDESHATLVAAVEVDGIIHLEVVKDWVGKQCRGAVIKELPDVVGRIHPRAFCWFPNGPTAALAAELRANWAPKRCKVDEIRGEMTATAMGLAEAVIDHRVRHNGDPLLTRHAEAAQRLKRGDAWTFTRKGDGPVDAIYAAAGAAHTARTMPTRTALVAV